MGSGRGAHILLTVTRSDLRPATGPGPQATLRCVIGPRRRRRSESALAISGCAQTLVDLLAGGTHRELLGVAARDPDLAAEGNDGFTGHCALHDLVLADIVREALVVARLDLLLDALALDHRRMHR